jgi:hypothetical protein
MSRFSLLLLLVFSIYTPENTNAQTQAAAPVRAIAPFETDTLRTPVPVNRSIFVDKIKAQIKRADLRDGTSDQLIELEDPDISQKLTDALLVQAPKIWVRIENMDADHQQKIRYLHALEIRMRYWNALPATKDNATYVVQAVANFNNILKAIHEKTISSFINDNQNIITVDNSELLNNYPELKAKVYQTMGKANPALMITRLPEYAKETYADTIIAAAAKKVPAVILNYALATGELNAAVRRNEDAYVKTIVNIAYYSVNPRKVLPFIDEIYAGRKTIAEVDNMCADATAYFKALVLLKLQGPTLAAKTIDDEINYRGLQFVRVVNELHESPPVIRYKSLGSFGAEDLYFMMAGSQDEIYTSSFIWMFSRMMAKMKPLNGSDFLEKVHNNRFRTFIRMAAGYNELSTFLASMNPSQQNTLMKAFVSNLEQGPMGDLEDAVDVADAFGSVSDPTLIAFLKDEIHTQYERKVNEKGRAIYALLYTIFNNSDASAKLNEDFTNLLPPITYVPQSALRDKDGKIVEQVFFYGDKDGMGAFNGYLGLFEKSKWKIEKNKYWATITSKGKVKITIYVNVPLPEEATENDVFAQTKLQDYIDENDLKPSVIIHRGHSYYLPETLDHLTPAAKIIILGSCGGYHNLAKVLDSSPDANIISSKQVGAYRVNTPIISAFNDALLSGKDINWIDIWSGLSKYFANKGAETNDLFSDYVPPNKNLGTIFIKAYRKQVILDKK